MGLLYSCTEDTCLFEPTCYFLLATLCGRQWLHTLWQGRAGFWKLVCQSDWTIGLAATCTLAAYPALASAQCVCEIFSVCHTILLLLHVGAIPELRHSKFAAVPAHEQLRPAYLQVFSLSDKSGECVHSRLPMLQHFPAGTRFQLLLTLPLQAAPLARLFR